MQPDVRRVLVYRLGSLGDTVVALPSLHLIARAFPNAERRMLTNMPVASIAPAAAAVLGSSGLIHGYERYTVGMRQPLKLLELIWRLRRFGPEVIVYLKDLSPQKRVRRDTVFLRVLGASRIIGLPSQPQDFLYKSMPDGTLEYEAVRLARSLGELGTVRMDDPASWDIRLTEAEQASAAKAIAGTEGRPFFAVSVGTKVQAKNWGPANWRALLADIAQQYPLHALMLAGAREESDASQAAAQGWRATPGSGPVMNLCGELTPRESAAVFARARAFLGHDSGPMHLASISGTPTVAIFAARNQPRTWFPMCPHQRVIYHRVDCWGCGLETCIEQRKKCILSITVQEVMQALHEMLSEVDATPAGSAVTPVMTGAGAYAA